MTLAECVPGVRVRLNKLGRDWIEHSVLRGALGQAWLNRLSDEGVVVHASAYVPPERAWVQWNPPSGDQLEDLEDLEAVADD